MDRVNPRFPFATANAGSNVTPRRVTSGNPRVGASEIKLNVPYRFGGNDRNRGVDCSGLTQCVYRENGIQIPRTAITQWKDRRFVPIQGDPVEGDLVFFDTGANRRKDNKIGDNRWVTHVAIVTADGRIVHATSSRGTRVETIDEFLKRAPRARLLGIRRLNDMAGR